MEILFEIIFGIIFEGSLELGTDKKVSKPIRILALVIFLLIYAAIITVLFLFAISMIKDDEMAIGVIIIVGDVLLLISGIWTIVKRYKKQNQ